jgi:hypothetical protein
MMTLALLMFVRVFAFDNQRAEASQCVKTCLHNSYSVADHTPTPVARCYEYSWYPNIDGCIPGECPGYCWTYVGDETNCDMYSPGQACTVFICTV